MPPQASASASTIGGLCRLQTLVCSFAGSISEVPQPRYQESHDDYGRRRTLLR